MKPSLPAEETQKHLDATVSPSSDVEDSMDSEDLRAADKAMETLAQSQDTLLADEDDSEVPQVQQKSVVDAEDEPTLTSEGAEELESTKSSEEHVVEPHSLVEDANQETNTTTPTAPHVEESVFGIVDVLSKDQYTVPAQETDTLANSVATKEHEDIETDLPTIKEILTEEADIISPKTTMEELPVVQDHDSADETANEVVNEKEAVVSAEPLGEEGTPQLPFTIHHMGFEIDKSC